MKKVLMPAMALLVLFVVAPVMAAPATKTPFTAEASTLFGNISPGIEWEADGIYHVKGAISSGTVTTISGPDISGTVRSVTDVTINTKTGRGNCHNKVVLTVEGVGTFEGSQHGSHTIIPIPDPPYLKDVISGSFALHGTGEFEGLKMMGSYEGEEIGGLVEMALEGIILSPKGMHAIFGDIDGNGVVNRYDFGDFGAAYGSMPGDPNWNEWCNLDCDGDVDRYDFGIFGAHYGMSDP